VLTDLLFVRKDWGEIAQRTRRDHRRVLSIAALVMLLATAGVYATLSLNLDKGLESFTAEALSYGLFLAVPVWYAFRHQRNGWQKAVGVYLFFLAVMLVNDLIIKGGLRVELVNSPRANAPRLGISVSMLLIWLVPLWLMRAHPAQARAIGLNFERAGPKILYGILGATILIAHLWVTLLYAEASLGAKPWPFLLFSCCYEIAAQSLSEELFFRGFLLNYLHHVRQHLSMVLVSLLNVLIYVVKFRTSGETIDLFGPAFYAFVMAMLNAALYRQLGGILPGLIVNVLFSMAGILR
jgi:hypothetical protein